MPGRIDRTDREIKDALESCGWLIGKSARALDMSPQTLRRRIDESPTLGLPADERDAYVSDLAQAVIIQKIYEGDRRAAWWWLIRRDPRFSVRLARTEVAPLFDAERLIAEFASLPGDCGRDDLLVSDAGED